MHRAASVRVPAANGKILPRKPAFSEPQGAVNPDHQQRQHRQHHKPPEPAIPGNCQPLSLLIPLYPCIADHLWSRCSLQETMLSACVPCGQWSPPAALFLLRPICRQQKLRRALHLLRQPKHPLQPVHLPLRRQAPRVLHLRPRLQPQLPQRHPPHILPPIRLLPQQPSRPHPRTLPCPPQR